MNDFVRCNKVSGVHWLKTPVDNLIISIKLKPPDDILSLPKFEDYTKESDTITIQPNIEEHTFKWQQKLFSAWEVHHYTDIHNCIIDTELEYHEILKNNEIEPAKVFSYTNDDCHMPLPYEFKNKSISKLERCMEYLNLNDGIDRAFGGKSDSMHHLLKSRTSLCEDEKWTAMHVVYDHSDKNESAQYLKQETILLSMFYNTTQNYMILAPDINDIELNPYAVDAVDIKYGVSVDFGEMEGGDELEMLLTRLYSKWQKKHLALVNFITPHVGTTQYYVTIDLLYAEGFETKDMYVEYTIKLPDGVQCNDILHGRTHTSESTKNEDIDVWNFGHLIELGMDTETPEPPPLKLYLEIISRDCRHNHRTEGYAHHLVPLAPALRTLALTCLRPEESSCWGEDRRYFLGGCNLIEDLDVLSKTDGQNANFIYKATGKIHIRYSVISQSSCGVPGSRTRGFGGSSSSGSALLLGAEAALNQYKKARARLAAATKDIHVGSGDG